MNSANIKYELRNDAEGYIEIVESHANGDSFLWDARFPSQVEADAAIETSKRRRACRAVWGL